MARRFKGPISTKWTGRGAGGRKGAAGFKRGTFRRVGGIKRIASPFGGLRGGAVFSLNMNQFKSFFFDRQDWEAVLEPAEYKFLWWTGQDLMEQARRLIRKRKKPSREGSSPTSWGPSHKLKKSIFYGIDLPNLTLVVGPIKFDRTSGSKPLSQPTIPAILQFGGKIWHAWPAKYEPPRVTNEDGLPGRRVVNIAPRPYMDKAYRQKEAKILKRAEDMLGKAPESILIAHNRGQKAKGFKKL